MKKRFVAPVIAGTSAIAISLSACGGPGESDPKPIAPNGTIEQVAHNLGYADTLGKLTLHQTIHSQTSSGEALDVYDYTKRPIDAGKLNKLAAFYLSVSTPSAQTEMKVTLHPYGKNGHATDKSVTANLDPQIAKEHDFVLVPNGTHLPPSFTRYNVTDEETDAETENFDTVSQEISVVKQPLDIDTYQPTDFLNDSGMATEMCQSLVHVSTLDELPSSETLDGWTLAQRLVQETVCNGYGDAFSEAYQGIDYATYRETSYANTGTVSVGMYDTPYIVDPYVVTPGEYAELQAIAAH